MSEFEENEVEEEGELLSIEEPPPGVEDTDDGGAIIELDDGEDDSVDLENLQFYRNLALELPMEVLDTLATNLLQDIEDDQKSREKHDKAYADAIQRTGLGGEAPGGASFEGASKAVHPMLTEACIDFAARTVKEIFPPGGPVKTFIPGMKYTPERLEKADRKKDCMNWQFTTQMPSFREELEQLMTQVPLGGSQYLRLVYDSQKKKPVPVFVSSDFVYLPYSATSFYSAERKTYAEPITTQEFKRRIDRGQYRDVEISSSSVAPTPSASQKASEKVEGKVDESGFNKDGLRLEYEVSIEQDFSEAELKDGLTGPGPYLITIDSVTRKIVSVVRNWEQDDETRETMDWLIEFPFIPWRGAYTIGLGQIIGSMAGAATGALRALLDSAHVNNLPTALKLKGANLTGQQVHMDITTIVEIEGAVGVDDIRKLVMPVPFNPPSATLFQLLGFLVDAGRGVVRTVFEKLGDQTPNMPVGTTLALIEEGMQVLSGIHLRLYHSMGRVIKVLERINRMYLDEDELRDELGEVLAKREDFKPPLDVIPVADPYIFSEVQRLAQMQIVAARAQQNPDLYDRRKVEQRLLERTKIPNPEELLIPAPKPRRQNAVNENASMSLGRPVFAFPDQDHLGHIQTLLDYLQAPLLGSNPLIAPTYLPQALAHLKEHLVLWYVSSVHEKLQVGLGGEDKLKEVMRERSPETLMELDRTLAVANRQTLMSSQQVFSKIPEVISKAQAMMQQFQQQQPQLPLDPNAQMLVQQKEQSDQRKAKLEGQKLAQKAQADQLKAAQDEKKRQLQKELKFMELSAREREEALRTARAEAQQAQEYAARLEELQLKERAEDERLQSQLASEEKRNAEDNLTALSIAEAEIDSSERVSVETGTGINPDPSD